GRPGPAERRDQRLLNRRQREPAAVVHPRVVRVVDQREPRVRHHGPPRRLGHALHRAVDGGEQATEGGGGAHRKSVRGALRSGRPKVEVYENFFFLVVHGLALDEKGELVDSEIHAFAGHRYLVTLRYDPPFDITEVLRRWDRQPELTHEGGAFLLYALLDEVVDGYYEVIERLEDLSDDIEDRVFGEQQDQTVQQDIFQLKRKVVQFRRLIIPLREVLDLVEEQPGFVTVHLGPYYRDVMDHLIRSLEFADNVRDLLTTALEAQLSQISNRLNIVMKQLTSWAAIVLVPTLIAGIYGMNFRNMPELKFHFGYYGALGLMLGSMV